MTANNFEWFQNAITTISNDDNNRTQVLSELKLAISSLNVPQLRLITRSLQLNVIFDCLNSSDTEQVKVTCDVLEMLLLSLEPGVVLGQYGYCMRRALSHPGACSKKLAIKELQRIANDDAVLKNMGIPRDMLLLVVASICHEDMSVASSTMSLLVKLGSTPFGLQCLFSESVQLALRGAMSRRDIVRFRVYEVMVDIAVQSQEGLDAADKSGMLPNLLKELRGPDVLLQLNCLELLTNLALCDHGLHYLEHHGILKSLAAKVSAIDEDPLASLILPGLIKFFGNVAQARPKEVFAEYPAMVKALFETFQSPDLVLLGVAMETVGYIGTTVEGKYMLASLGETMDSTMKCLADKISDLPTEWRVRALNTVANLLKLKESDQDTQSLELTKSWFEHLSSDPMSVVMSVCRQPFIELRLAGLQILQVLAEQQWGQEYINKTP
ncbi:hypothetical protein L9F63_019375, partial [Diploptera punctata]